MGLLDRDYMRGEHPPACTCAECSQPHEQRRERVPKKKSVRVGDGDKMIVVATNMLSTVSNEGFDRKGALERIVEKVRVSNQIVLVDVEELAMWGQLVKAYKKQQSIWGRLVGVIQGPST